LRSRYLLSRSYHCAIRLRDEKPHQENEFKDTVKEMLKTKLLELSLQMAASHKFNFGTFASQANDVANHPLTNFHLKVYKSQFDKDFNENEFLEGCKEAYSVVRPILISGQISEIEHMIAPASFAHMQKWYEFAQQQGFTLIGDLNQVTDAQIYNIKVKGDPFGKSETQIAVRVCLFEFYSHILLVQNFRNNIINTNRSHRRRKKENTKRKY
jgi:hypothetical protein